MKDPLLDYDLPKREHVVIGIRTKNP